MRHKVLLHFLRSPEEGARYYARLTASLDAVPDIHVADVSDRADQGTKGSYALLATLVAESPEHARSRVSALLGDASTSTSTCAAARVLCHVEQAAV